MELAAPLYKSLCDSSHSVAFPPPDLQSDLQHPVVLKTEETASAPSNDGRIDQFFSPVHNEDNDLNLHDKSCK